MAISVLLVVVSIVASSYSTFMTLPMTFRRVQTHFPSDIDPVVVIDNRYWVQTKPYDLVLPWEYYKNVVLYKEAFGTENVQNANTHVGPRNAGHSDSVANVARKKFAKRLGDTSQMLNNLIEYKSARDSLVKRTGQLFRFARALRKLDFRAASRELGVKRVPNGLRRRSKDFGSNYLEYAFGWAPLMDDISTSISIFSREFSNVPIRVRHVDNNLQSFSSQGDFGSGSRTVRKTESRVQIGAIVRFPNPNATLANQLGLSNLPAVVWEAVPFSYIVDQFVNIGDYLSQWFEFSGYVFQKDYTTTTQIVDEQSDVFGEGYSSRTGTRTVYVDRVLGIPPVTIQAQFSGFSLQQGATHVALLLTMLKSRKPY